MKQKYVTLNASMRILSFILLLIASCTVDKKPTGDQQPEQHTDSLAGELFSPLDATSTIKDQELRDNMGRIIGKIRTTGSGKQEIRDNKGRLKGTYDPKSNTTRDHMGRLVGTGNLLTSLLFK